MNKYLEKFISDKFKEPGLALDLGCGRGHDAAGLAALGWKTVAVDKRGIAEDQIVWDLETPYVDEQDYDLVYSNYVLPFIDNKEGFVKNIHAKLKNGGWTFIATFSREDEQFKIKGTNKEELKELFKDFRNIEVIEDDYYDDDPGHMHWHKLLILTAQK